MLGYQFKYEGKGSVPQWVTPGEESLNYWIEAFVTQEEEYYKITFLKVLDRNLALTKILPYFRMFGNLSVSSNCIQIKITY